MDVLIKRVDREIPIPSKQSLGAIGIDLYVREDAVIGKKSFGFVKLNNVIKVPRGCALLIFPRSSTAFKKGLILANSIGLIDEDFCGEDDEIRACFYNVLDEDVSIKKGDRLVQAVFMNSLDVNFIEVEKMKEETRGGFGSTGD